MTATDPISRDRTAACPLCGESRWEYLFTLQELSHSRCAGCGLIAGKTSNPPKTPVPAPAADESDRDAATLLLERLHQAGVRPNAQILLIAPHSDHPLAEASRLAGYKVTVHTAESWPAASIAANQFAGVILYQTLENWTDPDLQLDRLWQTLDSDGVLIVSFQALDSWPARLWKNRWIGWQANKHCHFTRKTVQLILLKSGFNRLWLERDRRRLSLQHIADRLTQSPRRGLLHRMASVLRWLPAPWRQMLLRLPTSGVLAVGQKGARRERPLVSIVVPVYNEKENFGRMMEGLLNKKLPGADREIIIVESNSSDGTREVVLSHANHPEVRICLQDRPRGKGDAVREGFAQARGDILMIQDADMEYDFDDYDALLEPLIAWKELFVLGARHGGSWKMRQFSDQPVLAHLMNAGHVFFTTLINLLYGQHMKDPFTMFKVFRSDGLFGLTFQARHFDFDHELVIKLVLRHYPPREFSVNYRSRSYKEGKKVNMFKEPFRWLRVDFSNRLRRLPVPERIRPAGDNPPGSINPQPVFHSCPLCQTGRIRQRYRHAPLPIQYCENCDIEFLDPQTSDAELVRIYSEQYFIGAGDADAQRHVSDLKSRTAALYLERLRARKRTGRLLEIGCGQGDFLLQARAAGYTVSGLDFSAHAVAVTNDKAGSAIAQAGDLSTAAFPENHFDAVVMFDLIEHVRNPADLLQSAWRVLKPGGTLMLVTPAHDSLTARWMGVHWMEYKAEHLYYFSRSSLCHLLQRDGFAHIEFCANTKYLSLNYLTGHFCKFPVPVLTPLMKVIPLLLPAALTHHPLRLPAAGLVALADKSEKSSPCPKLATTKSRN